MRVTGWTMAALRRQPAPVIRAHFHRIYAGLVWDPKVAAMAASRVDRDRYASFPDYIAARDQRARAEAWIDNLTEQLWPEDRDA